MRALFTSTALLVLAAAPVAAQSRPQVREGFTVSFGVGAGSAGATCTNCDSGRETAPSLYLRLGGAARPNLILAGEINGWSKTEEEIGVDVTLTVATVNFVAQWYPQPANGFFVSAGVGAGSMSVELKVPRQGTFTDRSSGFGYQVGTGYDIRMGRNFSLTPFATYFGTAGGKFENSSKVDANVFHIGLGFTWH